MILGKNYDLPIDMWSFGCIIAELFTGVPVFPGEDENEQITLMLEVLEGLGGPQFDTCHGTALRDCVNYV